MKKTIITLTLLLILSTTLSANSSWNPFQDKGHWLFTLEDGTEFLLYFKMLPPERYVVMDEDGNEYNYSWRMRVLKIFCFPLREEVTTLEFKVDAFTGTETDRDENFSGYIVESGERVSGEHVFVEIPK